MIRLFALGVAAAFVLSGPAGTGKPLRLIVEKEPMTRINVNDTTKRPAPGVIPPIDTAAPVKTETATFALG